MSIFSSFPGDPPEEGREPIPEEDTILDRLEASDMEQAVIDEVMGIVAGLVDKLIWERDKECAACMARLMTEPTTQQGVVINSFVRAFLVEIQRRFRIGHCELGYALEKRRYLLCASLENVASIPVLEIIPLPLGNNVKAINRHDGS